MQIHSPCSRIVAIEFWHGFIDYTYQGYLQVMITITEK